MVILRNKKTQTEALYPLHIKTIYNFSYRLSGNEEIAGILTEKIFLDYRFKQKDKFQLLKQTWEDFLKYYGCIDLKCQDTIQKILLSLPPKLRCAVILRDIMDCSYQQISIVLNQSDYEAAELVSRGREQFARLYKKSNTCV